METNAVTVSLRDISTDMPVQYEHLVSEQSSDGGTLTARDQGNAPGEHSMTPSALSAGDKSLEEVSLTAKSSIQEQGDASVEHLNSSKAGGQGGALEEHHTTCAGDQQKTLEENSLTVKSSTDEHVEATGQHLKPSNAVGQGKAPEVRIPRKSPRAMRHVNHRETIEDRKRNGADNANNDTADRLADQVFTTDGGRVLRKKRRSTQQDAAQTCCTICGLTVRPSELQNHYDWEVDKLNKMLRLDGTRIREQKSDRDRHDRRKASQSSTMPSTTSGKRKLRERTTTTSTDDVEEEAMVELSQEERLTEFDRIKRKRQERLYSRLRKHKMSDFDNEDGPSTSADSSDSTTCPICHVILTGTAEERNSHAEACLTSGRILATQEDEDVDIEDQNESFDEYTWCGQTRIRVTSMLETGFKGLGYEVRKQNNDADDTELNIESDDDSAEFGVPQYSEADIIPCGSEDMDEHTQTLRNAVLEGSQERVPPLHKEGPIEDNRDANANVPSSHQQTIEASTSSDSKASYEGNPLYPGQSRTVVDCLRAKIEELEKAASKQDSIRCLICMDAYRNATVSVQCWHVHCEECWLRTLGAKKLCPQCNMITSPNQLRRIYL